MGGARRSRSEVDRPRPPSRPTRPIAARHAPTTPSLIVPSPFAALPPGTVLQRSPQRLLLEVSQHLEREVVRTGETAVVTSAVQDARLFLVALVALVPAVPVTTLAEECGR